MITKFTDEEFIDGCYSGIMRLQDVKDTIQKSICPLYMT
jgi:hypothetical protein